MENKRKFPRFSLSEPVGYSREGQAPEGSLSEDVSETGIKLTVSQFVPRNTLLELQIQLPGKVGVIPARAKVIWVKEVAYRDDAWEIGLQIEASPEYLSAVHDYISFYRFESLS
jgi:hypothetical protein